MDAARMKAANPIPIGNGALKTTVIYTLIASERPRATGPGPLILAEAAQYLATTAGLLPTGHLPRLNRQLMPPRMVQKLRLLSTRQPGPPPQVNAVPPELVVMVVLCVPRS